MSHVFRAGMRITRYLFYIRKTGILHQHRWSIRKIRFRVKQMRGSVSDAAVRRNAYFAGAGKIVHGEIHHLNHPIAMNPNEIVPLPDEALGNQDRAHALGECLPAIFSLLQGNMIRPAKEFQRFFRRHRTSSTLILACKRTHPCIIATDAEILHHRSYIWNSSGYSCTA